MSGYLLGGSVVLEGIITGVMMSRVRKDGQQLDNASAPPAAAAYTVFTRSRGPATPNLHA